MRRRDLIALLGGATILRPLAVRGQPVSVRPLIAFLAGGRQTAVSGNVNAFREGLRELGYDEGRSIEIVYRFADGRVERYPVLAEELVRLKPAVILAGAVDALPSPSPCGFGSFPICPACDAPGLKAVIYCLKALHRIGTRFKIAACPDSDCG
jgi:hypothetical protein